MQGVATVDAAVFDPINQAVVGRILFAKEPVCTVCLSTNISRPGTEQFFSGQAVCLVTKDQ